jgi:two-component system sensor histidine kinase BaeS
MEIDALIHEMRNELAVAKANLEGFVDGKFEPTRERLLGILQALNQLDALIEDVRRARPAAAMSAAPRLINVCELLTREYSAVDAVAGVKNIKLSIHRCGIRSAKCMQFYADPARIGQIAKNVLLNAIRYTPKGGTVSIDCSHSGDQLQVRISDTGPGVREEEREAVFQAGYRGAAGVHTPGSGYGLAVTKQLVEEQGGSIRVDSVDEHGAAFTVRLPGEVPKTT